MTVVCNALVDHDKRGGWTNIVDQQPMSTIIAAFTNFGISLAAIGLSLLHSVLAVSQAIFALVQNTIENILKLGHSITTLVLELFQGFVGFIIGESSSL